LRPRRTYRAIWSYQVLDEMHRIWFFRAAKSPLLRVVRFEITAHVQNYQRKLQSLGLVDRHHRKVTSWDIRHDLFINFDVAICHVFKDLANCIPDGILIVRRLPEQNASTV